MPAYIIAEIEVTDPAGYEPYRPLAAASVTQYGGRYLVRGGGAERLEGPDEPQRLVVIEFPDAATAHRWYNSSEYQAALPVRLANARSRVFVVEGA